MKEIKGLKLQVNDLKESMEFTQNCPDQKVAGVEEKISTFEIAMNEMYTTKLTPIMSMIVCQNCETRYRRCKTCIAETIYRKME